MKVLLLRLKGLLIHYIFILKAIKILNNAIFGRDYKRLVGKRAKMGIFEYNELVKPIRRYFFDYVPENNDNCMSYCLKEYMGVKVTNSINAMIEHGLFFGDYVAPRQHAINVPSIITFGSQRVKHLAEKGVKKNVITIGPYIHYAKPFLSDTETKELKRKLGKTLLVFPSHSLASEGVCARYDKNEFIAEIDHVAKNFDTVMISLHYCDALLSPLFESKGYICVTSGNTNDVSFMRRQRSLIELSDMTMSNGVGTHIGYCIYLKKPHYIFKQIVKQTQRDDVKKLTSSWRDPLIFENEVNEVAEAFSIYRPSISPNQIAVVEKYWGLSLVKSPEELRSLLTFSKI